MTAPARVAAAAAAPDPGEVAFGSAPGAPLRVRIGAPAREQWLVAVALGGQGRYAAAAAVLEALLRRPGVPVEVAAHAAVTLASHLRQLGGHGVARRYDALGLRLAGGRALRGGGSATPHPDDGDLFAAWVDALVGLAADAIGTAAPGTAQRLLDRARGALDRAAEDDAGRLWRPSVRLGWVSAELALVRGEPAAAVEPARCALWLARRAASVRHVVKSRIVLAVAAGAAGADPDLAVAELDALGDEAERWGLLPLSWPARLAAADLLERPAAMAHDANDGETAIVEKSVSGLVSGAARRRHAALATLSVIRNRCHPVGRRLLGEATGVCAQPPVM